MFFRKRSPRSDSYSALFKRSSNAQLAVIVFLAHIWMCQNAVADKVKVNENAANVALLRPSEQSSTFASKIANLAVDGNPETCSVTEGAKDDNQRWWSVQLKSNVNVREVAVTINHGVAFHQQFTVFIIARSGDLRTKFVKCKSFDGLFRAGMRHVLKCPDGGITGEKVYIRDDRRQGTSGLSLCEVEVVAHSSGICSEPQAIANGTFSVLGGSQQQLRYKCHAGFLLLGNSDLYCKPDNTWSSPIPKCGQISCGYPMVEDVNAVVASSHYTIEKSMGATMGDESTIMCNEGYQMVANFSMTASALETTGLKAVQDVKVICGRDGEWERPFQYNCIDRDIFAQMAPGLKTSSIASSTTGLTSNSSFTTQSVVYTLLAIIFFILLLLVLTLLLRRKRVKSLRRRAEASVTMPRMHSEQGIKLKSSRPLISIFTTLDNKSCSSASTTNLMQSQHNSSSNAKLLTAIDDDSLSRTQPHQALFKLNKKIGAYEEELQLPESGSLVQGVSVDPHSAVFGRNGVRLEELERQFQNGLPDVTVANYYNRPTPYLSSFQPPAASNPWNNHIVPAPPHPVRPSNGGEFEPTAAAAKQPQTLPSSSLPSTSHHNGIPRLFSVRSLNESVIMAAAPPPPTNFNTTEANAAELPELDEAGYASLIMRSNKSMEVHPEGKEPVYERIKGERAGPQEILAAHDNFSDSSESHAYYSKVPKEDCSLEPSRPPPLKEHLYQNFDQVFLALEEQQRSHPFRQHHPDLLHNSSGINDGFYENTRGARHEEAAEVANSVVVSDEKLRTMYAQVDVAKKHFERNHKAASMAGLHNSHASGLQVVDQDLHELGSMSGASLPKSSPFSDVDLGSVHTAWEEHI